MNKNILMMLCMLTSIGLQARVVETGNYGTPSQVDFATINVRPFGGHGPEVTSGGELIKLHPPVTQNKHANELIMSLHKNVLELAKEDLSKLTHKDIINLHKLSKKIVVEAKALKLLENKDTIHLVAPYVAHIFSVIDAKKSQLTEPMTKLKLVSQEKKS